MLNVSKFEKRAKFRAAGKKWLENNIGKTAHVGGGMTKTQVDGCQWQVNLAKSFLPFARRASATTLRSNKPKGKCNKRENLVRDRPHRGCRV